MKVTSFPNISSRAFEHPADRAALVALKKMKGFDTILRKFIGNISEQRLRLMFLANSIRVNERQRPDVHKDLIEVCRVLDLKEIPELYISPSPLVNAMAIGVDRPFIVLNSAMLQSLKSAEIRAVLAHEVGHILSGHSLYRTLSFILLSISNYLLRGALAVIGLPIMLALKEWERKSELSADRAALLVTQDLELVLRVMMRLAGALDDKAYNLEEFERQAQEYREGGSFLDGIYKILNILWFSHPFPVLRIQEIRAWHDGDQYKEILAGNYPRREDDDHTTIRENVVESTEHYRKEFENAKDTVSEFLKDVASTGEDILGILRRGRNKKTGTEN